MYNNQELKKNELAGTGQSGESSDLSRFCQELSQAISLTEEFCYGTADKLKKIRHYQEPEECAKPSPQKSPETAIEAIYEQLYRLSVVNEKLKKNYNHLGHII